MAGTGALILLTQVSGPSSTPATTSGTITLDGAATADSPGAITPRPGSEATFADNLGVSSFNITIPATTAGDSLVLVVGPKSAAVTSVTGGGTWALAASTNSPSIASQQVEVWVAPNVAAGVTSLAVTLSGNSRVVAHVMAWPATLSVPGSAAVAVGADANPTTGSITPPQSAGVLYAATNVASTASTFSARPVGFTAPPAGNVESAAAAGSGTEIDVLYLVNPGTSARTPSWTKSTTLGWGAVAVEFVAAATESGTPATASGGITLGGAATAGVAATATGVISLSGAPAARATAAATGTITLGGTSTAASTASAAGSLTLGSTVVASATAASAGTLSLGGSVAATASAVAAGTLTLAGTVAARGGAVAGGTVTLSGTATAGTPPSSAAGSVTLGGSATASARATSSGAIVLGGTATGTAAATATPATAAGVITLGGVATARVPATAAGLITLSGLARVQAARQHRGTYSAKPGASRTYATAATSRAPAASGDSSCSSAAGSSRQTSANPRE